jgi:hypothetical protein
VEISFCDDCNSSIPLSDLERGVARRTGGRLLCAPCVSKARRAFLTRTVILPLALLVAAAGGAALAVAVMSPRLSTLDGRLSQVREEVRALPAPEVAAAKEVEGVLALQREQARSLEELGRSLAARDEVLGKAVEGVGSKIDAIAGELRAVKERLAEMAEEAGPAAPAAGPSGDGGLDVDTALGLLERDAPLTRLSALAELEGVDDPRVTKAVVTSLYDGDPSVRAKAVEMTGRRKVRTAVPRLVQLLEEDLAIRKRANEALIAITGIDFQFDPTEPDEKKREEAIQAYRDWWSAHGKD